MRCVKSDYNCHFTVLVTHILLTLFPAPSKQSTDVGDYFPDDYQSDFSYTDGMMGSQNVGGNRKGPELPGMENLGADALMTQGLKQASEIPEGMDFTPSSVPDGEVAMQVAASGAAVTQVISIAPVCMTFEDFYAAFAPGSHQSFSVSPAIGRMDRRGGVPTDFSVTCDPRGQAGDFQGMLVINLPEDNSKITYKITARSY